jgi:3-oxoadipate CoA-transferase, alpha subunit
MFRMGPAFVSAVLDRWVYKGTSRTFNATMAGAARVNVVEVEELVRLGDIDPEVVVTPGIYVDRIVRRS